MRRPYLNKSDGVLERAKIRFGLYRKKKTSNKIDNIKLKWDDSLDRTLNGHKRTLFANCLSVGCKTKTRN